MSKVKIFLFCVFVLLAILGILLWVFITSLKKMDISPTVNQYTIEFEEIQDKLFIEARIWGLAGNHEAILISSNTFNNEVQYHEDKEYIFFNSELFYKKIGIDTLLLRIYHAVKVPEKMFTKVKIVQIEFESPHEIDDYKENYKKYGFTLVSTRKEQ